jgi:squalene-hopene/tetraprenyl-beta-curcumene cyclase
MKDPQEISAALSRACARLLSLQRADGSWEYPCDFGPSVTAQCLIALRHIRQLTAEEQEKILQSLAADQRADGGFEAYPGADISDLGATATAMAAFLREPNFEANYQRASAWVQANGGLDAVIEGFWRGVLALPFLVVAGVLPPSALPSLPPAVWLIPGAIQVAGRAVHRGILLMMGQLSCLKHTDTLHRGARARALSKIIALHDEIQNTNGSFVANTTFTAMAALGLAAATSPEDDRVTRAAGFLRRSLERREDGSLYFPGNHSDVWSTALSLRALLYAGASFSSELSLALDWLLQLQEEGPQAACNQIKKGAPLLGGFPFQKGNAKMADCDDTAIVIDTFTACLQREDLPQQQRERVLRARSLALDWLLAMQNKDGGWAAFTCGLPGKPPGPIMTSPPPAPTSLRGAIALLRTPLYAFGDPSTEDVTGRVLRAIGGLLPSSEAVRRGVRFLEVQQCPDGAWWGRWSTNFLWGTAHALVGLHAAGCSRNAPVITRGLHFLLHHQNPDGGFGELPLSYKDPSRRGQGPSMPPLTATIIDCLLRLGMSSHQATTRAVEYMIKTQQADGVWLEEGNLQVMIPPLSFYRYPGAGKHPCIEALALYQNITSNTSHSRHL